VRVIRKTRQFVRKWHTYSQWIGFRAGTLFLIFGVITPRSVRRVHVAQEHLYVRTATSDLRVAVSCLAAGEYDNLEAPSPAVIVDAGANIGASAIYFARRYPHARVFAIEPEQENYELLLRNTRKYKNIIPIQAALWGQRETRAIQDRFTGPWGYTVCEANNRTAAIGQQVRCITISSLLEDYKLPHIDILKMDIEGGEKNVLEHSEEWIHKVAIIIAELHDRICMGCDRAFYLATREFRRFEKCGEKVAAYRT
jgi:FkbM family methyltransferase